MPTRHCSGPRLKGAIRQRWHETISCLTYRIATVVTSSSSHRFSVRLNPAVSADSCVQGRLKPSGSAFPVGDAGGHDGSDSVGSGDSSVTDPPHRHCRNLQQLPQVQRQARPCGFLDSFGKVRLDPAVSADSCVQVRPKPPAQRSSCGRRRRPRRQRQRGFRRLICG
jgi:hypothetical protein